jgi:hypothetical protein
VATQKRLFGTLKTWTASEHGGWGFIDLTSGTRYFFHRRMIRTGEPLPGSACIFTPQPPQEGKNYPQALDVVIQHHSTAARTSTLPKKSNGGAS